MRITMVTYRKVQLFAILVSLAGLGLMAPFAYFATQNKVAHAKQSKPTIVPAEAPLPAATPTLITGKPVSISIPDIHVGLPIADGAFNPDNGKWTLSNDKAHYALPSIQPNNEQGNTLIYGHYRKEVFSRLRLMREGAEATITTDNGYRFVYVYKGTQTVNPADTSIFAYEGDPQLTLQTCSGAWMQNRQLYFFNLGRVEKVA